MNQQGIKFTIWRKMVIKWCLKIQHQVANPGFGEMINLALDFGDWNNRSKIYRSITSEIGKSNTPTNRYSEKLRSIVVRTIFGKQIPGTDFLKDLCKIMNLLRLWCHVIDS
jgi:hypothetical protein